MTAKEWLMRAYECEQRIRLLEARCERWRSVSTRMVARYQESGVKGGGDTDVIADCAAKLVDAQRQLQHEMKRLLDMKEEIAKALAALRDDRQRCVLEYRFLCYMKFEEIAEVMNYSRRQIFYLYKKGMENIALYCTEKCDSV